MRERALDVSEYGEQDQARSRGMPETSTEAVELAARHDPSDTAARQCIVTSHYNPVKQSFHNVKAEFTRLAQRGLTTNHS